jgi:hypothetical protein
VSCAAVLRILAPNRPVQLPTSPDEPLDARTSPSPPTPSRDPVHAHTPAVDLGLAKFSLALHAISLAFVSISKDTAMFTAATALGALAAGYSPTIHSLSLGLHTRRGGAPSEAGQLFGAMSVIQALGYVPIHIFSRGMLREK